MIKYPTWEKVGNKEIADTPFGTYTIGPSTISTGAPFWWSRGSNGFRPADSVEEAREAAHADYKERADLVVMADYSISDLAVIHSKCKAMGAIEGPRQKYYRDIQMVAWIKLEEAIDEFAKQNGIEP